MRLVFALAFVLASTFTFVIALSPSPALAESSPPATAVPVPALDAGGAETLAAWGARVEAEPGKALNHFNLGVAYHLQHDYQRALVLYEKVVALGSPLAPAARFYEAQIYESLRNRRRAKEIIATIAPGSVPKNLRARLLQLKNRLFLEDFAQETDLLKTSATGKPEIEAVPTSDERAISGFIDLSRGVNSNPQTTTDTSTTSVRSSPQTQAKAGLNYQPWVSPIHDLKLAYFFSGSFFDEASRTNYLYHDFTAPLSFYFGAYRLKFVPEYFADTLAGSAFSKTVGATFEITAKYDATYISLDLAQQKITNVSGDYSYLTGSQQKAQFSVQSQWSTSRAFGYVTYSRFSYVDTSTLASSYGSAGLTVGYSLSLLPFDFSLIGFYETRLYDATSGSTVARADQKTYADFQLGYLWSSRFRSYLDVTLTQNNSNFNDATDDRRYKQTAYSLGTSWSF